MILPNTKPDLTIRVSVTDRCQLRCQYCMPSEGVNACSHDDILRFEEIETFITRIQEVYNVSKVRLTGGDPLARKGIVDMVARLTELGIDDIAMTTNAQRLAGMTAELRDAGLDRVNISLDSLDPDTFNSITRGGDVGKTLAGIDEAVRAGLTPVKLNMVMMRGINDREVCDMTAFALEHGCELRFLELMPIGYGASLYETSFISSDEVFKNISEQYEIEVLPYTPGSSSKRYRVTDAQGRTGTIGFISPCSNPFCSGCTRLRLTSDGRLIGCLAREDGANIRSLIGHHTGSSLHDAVSCALAGKRMDKQFEQPAAMAGIGG